MISRLPPLNALRAFEVAARTGGIGRAARELGVTPGAVSKHISSLETFLGKTLIVRNRYGIELTDGGKIYASQLSYIFDLMKSATYEILRDTSRSTVSVWLNLSLAAEWLAPRLPLFRAAHPEIELHISASVQSPDFSKERPDITVIPLIDVPSDMEGEVLFPSVVLPVCSPEYAEQLARRQNPEIRGNMLLVTDNSEIYWTAWCRQAGIDLAIIESAPRFESLSATYQTARRGGGIAMGEISFLTEDLWTGRLVTPAPTLTDVALGWYAVRRQEQHHPALLLFSKWLAEEARKTRDDCARISSFFSSRERNHDLNWSTCLARPEAANELSRWLKAQ